MVLGFESGNKYNVGERLKSAMRGEGELCFMVNGEWLILKATITKTLTIEIWIH